VFFIEEENQLSFIIPTKFCIPVNFIADRFIPCINSQWLNANMSENIIGNAIKIIKLIRMGNRNTYPTIFSFFSMLLLFLPDKSIHSFSYLYSLAYRWLLGRYSLLPLPAPDFHMLTGEMALAVIKILFPRPVFFNAF